MWAAHPMIRFARRDSLPHEVDLRPGVTWLADDPGNTLFHCHHQDHMDEGFAGIITYT
jgi:FtsP/CotA-like multicopper oxidase with cupredoxin domain